MAPPACRSSIAFPSLPETPVTVPHADALDDLLQQVQQDHADDAWGAAERLVAMHASLAGAPAATWSRWLRLCEHVLLAHLDDAPRLSALLQQAVPRAPDDPAVHAALLRARVAQAWIDDPAEPAPPDLGRDEQVRALGTAASVQTMRGAWSVAAARMERAARAAAGDPAARKAYAALTHNLAVEIRLRPGELPEEARHLMLDAAHRSLDAWSEVGGWLEAERADYELAMCLCRAGRGREAVHHASRCLKICRDHGGDAFERFFGLEALAHAQAVAGDRDAALGALDEMERLAPGIDGPDLQAMVRGALAGVRSTLDAA